MTDCRWGGADQPRILPNRHDVDCELGSCRGCQPCWQPHCPHCGITHTHHVCPGCLHTIRGNLTEIVALHAQLSDEAAERGINSEAMNLAGPSADPEARGHLEASIAVGRIPADRLADHLPADDQHPLWVLETIAGETRDALDHDEPTTRATVENAAGYISRNLTDIARDPNVDLAAIAGQIADCTRHMLAVLGDRTRDRTGAPCPTCEPARVLVYQTTDDGHETWTCMGCRREWDTEQYQLLIRVGYLAHAEWLNGPDCAAKVGTTWATLRKWAERGLVATKHISSKTHYRVTDAQERMRA